MPNNPRADKRRPRGPVQPRRAESPFPVIADSQTLSSAPPHIGPDEARALALRHYGLRVEAVKPLASERDQNLLLVAEDGGRWVMKLANPDENPLLSDFQAAAICHLQAADPGLPVPRLRRSRNGARLVQVRLADGRDSALRLLSWVEGLPLVDAPRSAMQRRALARVHARLCAALAGFTHPGQDQYLQWDSSKLHRMRHLLPHVAGDEMRGLVAAVLDDFTRIALPVLPGLRRQVIYNDLNFHNVLVDAGDPDRIAGIIDFGDIVTAPLVNDLAVAASYQFGPEGNRAEAGDFIAAWLRELPLTAAETALLPLLVEARLALTLLITGYRASRYPENAPYILRNNAPARAALAEMRSLSPLQNAGWISRLAQEAA